MEGKREGGRSRGTDRGRVRGMKGQGGEGDLSTELSHQGEEQFIHTSRKLSISQSCNHSIPHLQKHDRFYC